MCEPAQTTTSNSQVMTVIDAKYASQSSEPNKRSCSELQWPPA
jgi:hypothetical protein